MGTYEQAPKRRGWVRAYFRLLRTRRAGRAAKVAAVVAPAAIAVSTATELIPMFGSIDNFPTAMLVGYLASELLGFRRTPLPDAYQKLSWHEASKRFMASSKERAYLKALTRFLPLIVPFSILNDAGGVVFDNIPAAILTGYVTYRIGIHRDPRKGE